MFDLDGVATTAVTEASSTAPAAPAPGSPNLVSTPVNVPGDLAQSPLDEPRQALIPEGWTIGVWARIPKARLETWTPDGALLVSVPASGQILKLTPKPGAAPQQSTLLEGLDQPHGMAFAGPTLYIAESDQIDAYDYVNGAAVNPRTVAADLPDARSAELNGAYAHALKSVAVGPDGAVYFSIGSTGNISEEDRDANPPRATIMRIPPGGVSPNRSRRASATAPGWPSRPTVRSGRRSTIAITHRTRTATSTPGTSTTILPRRWRD